MEQDILVIGRIILAVISITILSITSTLKFKQRMGNQFFGVLGVFWIGVLIVAINPNILDSVLNSTGLINYSQFLLGSSLIVIIYLLYIISVKGKILSKNYYKIIREVAIRDFKKK